MAPFENQAGSIDLRGNSQIRGDGIAEGYGIFAVHQQQTVPNSIYLGDNLDGAIDRDMVTQEFGLGERLVAATVRTALWEMLTMQSDPTAQSRVGTLMPGRDLKLELFLGRKIATAQFDLDTSPEAANVILRLQDDYRRVKALADDPNSDVPADHHRKVLGHWTLRKFRGVNHERFIPSDLPNETPIRPSTIITESFNQADSTTLGPDLTWTETAGDLETVSNQVQEVGLSGFGDARAEHDLSSDDHYAEIDHLAGGAAGSTDESRVIARFNASVRSYYTFRGAGATDAAQKALGKRTTGTFAFLGNTNISDLRGSTIKIECNGSTIRTLVDDVEDESITDTSFSGQLRTGLAMRDGGLGDNFEASDLAVGGRVPQLQMMGVA